MKKKRGEKKQVVNQGPWELRWSTSPGTLGAQVVYHQGPWELRWHRTRVPGSSGGPEPGSLGAVEAPGPPRDRGL